MGEVVLNIEGLVFGHKAPLVSQAVDISASAGDFICLVGRNGTGKTTMLSTLIGVKKPLAGHISICGVPLDRISAREKSRYISFVPSKVEAVLNMRIRDLIAVGRRGLYTEIRFVGHCRLYDYRSERRRKAEGNDLPSDGSADTCDSAR